MNDIRSTWLRRAGGFSTPADASQWDVEAAEPVSTSRGAARPTGVPVIETGP